MKWNYPAIDKFVLNDFRYHRRRYHFYKCLFMKKKADYHFRKAAEWVKWTNDMFGVTPVEGN